MIAEVSVGEIEDKFVLLVDDLTETAGTIVAAAELLKKAGAKKVNMAGGYGWRE